VTLLLAAADQITLALRDTILHGGPTKLRYQVRVDASRHHIQQSIAFV